MKFKEDVDSQLILTIGAISGFMVLVAVIGLQAWFMSEERRELDEKYSTSVNLELTTLHTEQLKNITTYRWIGEGKQAAAVPIDQAMTLLIQNKGKLPATQPR